MVIRAPTIGLFIGDPTGIGPEISVKVLAQRSLFKHCRMRVFGDARVFQLGQRIAHTEITCPVYNSLTDVDDSEMLAFIDVQNYNPEDRVIGKVDSIAGKTVGDTLKYMISLASQNHIEAVVYAPLNKEALYRGGYRFKGEIYFFAHLLKVTEGFGEMNVLDNLWTSRVTSHISISEVSQRITHQNVMNAIQLAHTTLNKAKIHAPKLGVAALNPHAGEGGLFGREEIEVIIPAIREANKQGTHAQGPYAADTIFIRAKKLKLDAIISMYHDQGQIAMKLMGFDRGVTINAGLPIIITTPSHGTAFDIAGKGIARPNALLNAVLLASKMTIRTR